MITQFQTAKAQQPVLNEIASSNHNTIVDEDGDFDDWIELYNPTEQPIALKGYGLSDDEDEPFQWFFAGDTLDVGEYLLVFASGKDRREIVHHYETIISRGDEWKFKIPQSTVSKEWITPGYDDTVWSQGASGFGYGDDDDATRIDSTGIFDPKPISVYLRKKFTIKSIDNIQGALLHVDYDDGFVAYLNGEEVARANVGQVGIQPEWDELARESHEAVMYKDRQPDRFEIADAHELLHEGTNTLAIEVHNAEVYSSDMTLIPFLTLTMSSVPDMAHGVDEELNLTNVTPQYHTNFSISSSGEEVVLTAPDGTQVDYIEIPELEAGYSIGRKPDGTGSWMLFDQPTPDNPNSTPGYRDISDPPEFVLQGGVYANPVQVELSGADNGAEIYYTLNGSVPTRNSRHYQEPITIDTTSVVRARIFQDGYLGSKPVTQSYIINSMYELPVISLATDPSNFFNDTRGIYVDGPNADPELPHEGANYNQDWERPIHIDLFEPDGDGGFSLDAGVQIFGSWSRAYPQRSLAFFIRGGYGQSELHYQLFPNESVDRFQNFILRNSGQDWSRTMFRDGFIHTILANDHLDTQDYRPAVVYLNGRFWGLYNIREKLNENYLASHHGIDPEQVDMIENDDQVVEGDSKAYNSLMNFIHHHDLAETDNYEWVKDRVDLDNFIDYMIGGMYVANSDWPWNNVKAWRPKISGGRFRWLTYDMDYGMHGGHLAADTDMFKEILNFQDAATVQLFEKLMTNETFKHHFINRYADRLNTVFDPFYLLNKVEKFKKRIEAVMPAHVKRWADTFEGPWYMGNSINTMDHWEQSIQVLRTFVMNRRAKVFNHIMQNYDLMGRGLANISLKVSDTGQGGIRINTIQPDRYPWTGQYFAGLSISLKAVPKPGYKFVRWEGLDNNEQQVVIKPGSDMEIKAVFEQGNVTGGYALVVNEINYNSSEDFNPEDWVELYNRSTDSVDMTNYILRDEEDVHGYTFPDGTKLPGKSYLVVCRDTSLFKKAFGSSVSVERLYGNFQFGLSGGGDQVRLYAPDGVLIDSVKYDDDDPWPKNADGNGPTLELYNGSKDNSDYQYWQSSMGHGTPGAKNSVIDAIEKPVESNPSEYQLHQNYPNPFNPSTTIRVDLPEATHLKLVVYNVQGREVTELANRKFMAGSYNFIFKADNLSSSVYFVRMKAGNIQRSRKMILLK